MATGTKATTLTRGAAKAPEHKEFIMNQGYGCWSPPPPWAYPPPQNDRNDDPIRMARRWEKFLKQERKDFKKDEKKEEKKTGKTFTVIEMFIILMCVSPFVAPLQKILLDQLWTKLLPH